MLRRSTVKKLLKNSGLEEGAEASSRDVQGLSAQQLSGDVERYAQMRVLLAQAGDDRARVLAENGLDEERWEAIDDGWQLRLDASLEASGEDVPALVQRYAEAFARAQRDAPGRVLPLELFAHCTRAVQGARDPSRALLKLGVSLTEYLRANQHWSPRFAHEPELAKRFQQALRRGRRQS